MTASNSSTIQEFLVSLGFKTDEASFSSADNKLKTFESSVSSAIKVVQSFVAAVVGMSAIKSVFNFANEIDDFVDLANRVNTTSEKLEELAYVAELTDSSTAALTSSIEALSNAAGDTFRGLGRAKMVFEKLGVSVADQNGKLKDSYDLLFEIGEVIKNMPRGLQTSALRRLGIDPTLLKLVTGEGAELREEFNALRGSIGLTGEESAKAADALTDIKIKFRLTVHEIKKALAAKVFVVFGEVVDNARKKVTAMAGPIVNTFSKIAKAVERLIRSFSPVSEVFEKVGAAVLKLSKRVLELSASIINAAAEINERLGGIPAKVLGVVGALAIFSGVAKIVAVSARFLLKPFLFLLTPLKLLPALIRGIFSPLKTLIALFVIFGKALMANPLGFLIKALQLASVAILALYDDFKVFQEGGKSFFNWKPFIDTLNIVIPKIKAFGESVSATFKKIKVWFDRLFKWADRLKDANFFDISLAIFDRLGEKLKWVGGLVKYFIANFPSENPSLIATVETVKKEKKVENPSLIATVETVKKGRNVEGIDGELMHAGLRTKNGKSSEKVVRPVINLDPKVLNFARPEKAASFSSPTNNFTTAQTNNKKSQVINNKTDISVTGVSEPKEVAREIEKAQSKTNDATARNFIGALR